MTLNSETSVRRAPLSFDCQIVENNEEGNRFLRDLLLKRFAENDLNMDLLINASWTSLLLLPGFFHVLQLNFVSDSSSARVWLKSHNEDLGATPEVLLQDDSGIQILSDYLWTHLKEA
jgi:hypothetical protein